MSTNIVIDTGAAVSIYNSTIIRSLSSIQTCNKRLLNASGVEMIVNGVSELEICLGDQKFIESLIGSTDCTHPILLGVDFMEKHKAVLDMKMKTMRIGAGRPVKLYTSIEDDSSNNTLSVTLIDSIDLPALSEVITTIAQQQDLSLQSLINWMKYKSFHDNAEEAKRIIALCNDFVILDDILYHLSEKNEDKFQLVVPQTLKEEILLNFHEHQLSGGH